MMPRFTSVLVLLVVGAPAVAAQGTLSTQGFGYPPGQLSTQAASMGGGIAETDPLSTLNPAALASWLASGVYFQYAPEYRWVNDNGRQDKTMTFRFPMIEGAFTAGPHVVFGLSASALLDRTWETERTGYDHFGQDSIPFTENFQSSGSINDVRFAVAANPFGTLWLGVGGDLYVGANQLRITRTTTDTTFGPFLQQSSINYSGSGVTGGIVWQPISALTIGASGGIGGRITATRNDTTLSHATIPKRAGGGITITAIPGLVLAGRADWEGWKSLAGLGTPGLGVVSTWDYGVGAEVRGPTLLGAPAPLRLGYRWRTLPFTVDGFRVREITYSVGLGIPIALGRSRIDLGLERANRGPVQGISEHAWTFSAGIIVRP